eukprot:jgi/Botrbrau1/1280/Bobra.0163s0063.2
MAEQSQYVVDGIKRVPLFVVSSQESLYSPIDRRSDYYRQRAREVRGTPAVEIEPQRLLNIPNFLTFARLILVPIFVFFWFSNHQFAPVTAAFVFILASATDWLDGYVARKMKIATEFGAFLDPVADKIMVSTALVLLAADPPAPLTQVDLSLPVLLIICREITMSSLREWAAASGGGAHKAVKVNSLGKWKTACQMVALSSMLLFRKGEAILGTAPPGIPRPPVACLFDRVIEKHCESRTLTT